MNTICYVVLFFMCSVHVVHTTITFANVKKLFYSLMSGRNPHLRPEKNQQTATNITVDFDLVSLLDVNAVAGTVSVTGFFRLFWTDSTVAWNSSEYGGIEKTTIPAASIWKPPLIILNVAKQFTTFGIEGSYLKILSNGTVFWEPGESITFTCSIDVTYFPFDTQKCQFDLVVWGFDTEEVRLYKMRRKDVKKDFSELNGEWQIIHTDIEQNTDGLSFVMHFKRRPLFLIISIILPIMFIALIDIFVFVLPQESGERIGFSITALLSLVVFLTIAQELLPATALPRLSIICVHLSNDMFMSGFITLSVIISSWIYHRPLNKRIPSLIRQMTNLQTFNSHVSPASNDEIMERNENEEKLDVKSMEKHEKMATKKDEEKKGDSEVTWQDVAGLWDFLSLVFYTFWFLVSILIFIVDINSGED